MLTLERKDGQAIDIYDVHGHVIGSVRVAESHRGRCKLSLHFAPEYKILRRELPPTVPA